MHHFAPALRLYTGVSFSITSTVGLICSMIVLESLVRHRTFVQRIAADTCGIDTLHFLFILVQSKRINRIRSVKCSACSVRWQSNSNPHCPCLCKSNNRHAYSAESSSFLRPVPKWRPCGEFCFPHQCNCVRSKNLSAA